MTTSTTSHQAPSEDAEPRHTNRLINETSPYLLQHAHNPVDWYPWGPEAFEAAREQGKMIFLSIGYSTCYWCHVMERESFENEAIAELMNANFICVKVDREERPDVDDIYMAAVQILNQGRGGWPMTLFLVPDGLKPFIGGTYFPPTDQGGRPGLPKVIEQVSNYWITQRDQVLQQANQVANAIQQRLEGRTQSVPLNAVKVQMAISSLMTSYDRTDAGYGRAPKFPMSANLDFLIRAAWDRQDVRQSIIHTLDRMATGGMYDQIGGGFHRYSTDTKWLVPHFEKMLYDNGQLATTYALAFERTDDPYYAEIIREILEFVLREMTGENGAFYSAKDAEVNAREGQNYIWTQTEIAAALTEAGLENELAFVLKVYGLDRGENFIDPHHREDGRKNVIFLIDRPDRIAAQMSMDVEMFNQRVAMINEALLKVRDQRDQPILDDKILAGWNGLMISGFADGGRVLGESRYIEAAKRSAEFILTEMRDENGRLLRSHRMGTSKIGAFAEDYAFFIRGLLALQRATGDSRWTEEVVNLVADARSQFWDDNGGGYYDTLPNQQDLFVRTKSTYDGAVPSPNAIMVHNLLDLYELTSNEQHLNDASASLASLSSYISAQPHGVILSTLALKRFADSYPQRIGLAKPVAVEVAEIKPPLANLDDPVQISSEQDRIVLSPGDRLTLTLQVRIREGYHINAHEPGPEFLIPLKVSLQNADGLAVEVMYPTGETYEAAAIAQEPMLIHSGKFEIPIRLERTGEMTGETIVSVTYQACTDRACMLPKTVVVPVKITGK